MVSMQIAMNQAPSCDAKCKITGILDTLVVIVSVLHRQDVPNHAQLILNAICSDELPSAYLEQLRAAWRLPLRAIKALQGVKQAALSNKMKGCDQK